MHCNTFFFHGAIEKIEFRKHLQQNIFDIEQWKLDAFLFVLLYMVNMLQ